MPPRVALLAIFPVAWNAKHAAPCPGPMAQAKKGGSMEELGTLESILEESTDSNNPAPERIRALMKEVRTIAVVGISRNPDKPARRVPSYLAARGYEIIPVNPNVDKVLGKEARASLAAVPEPVDLVLVFRPSAEAATIVDAAMHREERPAIWLQEGIRADEAANRARARGLTVVQDLCAFRVHQALERG
jgi:predicted CoA-binding protein